jgi:hypothetical protein
VIKKAVPFVGALIAVLVFIVFWAPGIVGGVRPTATSTAAQNDVAAAGAHVHPATATDAPAPIALVPPADGSRLALTTAPAEKIEQGYVVSVRVTSPAGKPVGEATIRFYDIVDLFGQREELIGTGLTDGQGQTAITYLPATTGAHEIVARFSGQGSLGASLGVTELDASVAAPTYTIDQNALASFSRYVPFGAGFAVLAVWALIAFSLIGTVRGIAVRANDNIRKGDPA